MTYFSKPDTDAWELHKGTNMLVGYDLVPERKITAGMQTLNDSASAVHILEVKVKA